MLRDQMLEAQKRRTRRKMWPMKVFDHAINLAVANTRVLKKCLVKKHVSMLDFRAQLIHELRLVALSGKV